MLVTFRVVLHDVLSRSPSGDRRLYMVYTAAFPHVSAGSVVLSRHEGPY